MRLRPSRQGSTPPAVIVIHPEVRVRFLVLGSLCLTLLLLTAVPAPAALPIRKPEFEAAVEKVVPATDAEKEKGVLVTVFLKDGKKGIPVTLTTAVHRQMGKLVPVVEVGEIKEGVRVSLWTDARTGKAEGVLIFP
jgi:hypothetical protein